MGGAVAAAAYGFAIRAVTQLRDEGTPNYWELAGAARTDMLAAFDKPA